MHSVASHWKGVRFAESIEHMVQYVAMELCYVIMVYSQRYQPEYIEYISKTIEKPIQERMFYIAAD